MFDNDFCIARYTFSCALAVSGCPSMLSTTVCYQYLTDTDNLQGRLTIMLGIHLVGCLSRVSILADTDHTHAVIDAIPTAVMTVLDAQFFGRDHQPPAGDQTCFGSMICQHGVSHNIHSTYMDNDLLHPFAVIGRVIAGLERLTRRIKHKCEMLRPHSKLRESACPNALELLSKSLHESELKLKAIRCNQRIYTHLQHKNS